MSYLVYARKYRPKTFEEMIGQKAVVQTLGNAIRNDRVAQAYLFSGMRGVGKTTAARILAKALNCQEGPTPKPCNHCDFCLEISEDRSLDVIEIDGASNNSVDEIRTLREGIQYKPIHCRYKVIIIDEIHMLSKSAFNALLKTLEEPPPNTIFIFATTEFHKVPATIVSRCQHFEFKRISHAETIAHLQSVAEKEGLQISARGLKQIAEAAEGSLRDAQSLLDQAVAFSGDEISDDDLLDILGTINRDILFRFSSAVLEEQPGRIFELVEQVIDSGYDLRFFHEELIRHFRDLLLVRTVSDTRDLLPYGEDDLIRYREEAARSGPEELLRCLDGLQQADQGIRHSPNPRICMEAALIKLCHYRKIVPLTELIRRVEAAGATPPAKPVREGERAGEMAPASGVRERRPVPARVEEALRPAEKPRPPRPEGPPDESVSAAPLPDPKKARVPAPAEKTPGSAPAPRVRKADPGEKGRKDPEVQTFLDTFKARIISVDDKNAKTKEAGDTGEGGQPG